MPKTTYTADIGTQFKDLTVIGPASPDEKGHRRCLARCVCGKELVIRISHAWRGAYASCGCRRQRHPTRLTHGASNTAEFKSWCHMKDRCYRRKSREYRRYGARGIRVCAQWRDSFETFLKDMGPKPTPKHSLDRRDSNGHYEPGNCRWADKWEQAANRRNNHLLEHDGQRLTLAEWSRRTGIRIGKLTARINVLHWPASRALTTP